MWVVCDLTSVSCTATNYIPRWWRQGWNTVPGKWVGGSNLVKGYYTKRVAVGERETKVFVNSNLNYSHLNPVLH